MDRTGSLQQEIGKHDRNRLLLERSARPRCCARNLARAGQSPQNAGGGRRTYPASGLQRWPEMVPAFQPGDSRQPRRGAGKSVRHAHQVSARSGPGNALVGDQRVGFARHGKHDSASAECVPQRFFHGFAGASCLQPGRLRHAVSRSAPRGRTRVSALQPGPESGWTDAQVGLPGFKRDHAATPGKRSSRLGELVRSAGRSPVKASCNSLPLARAPLRPVVWYVPSASLGVLQVRLDFGSALLLVPGNRLFLRSLFRGPTEGRAGQGHYQWEWHSLKIGGTGENLSFPAKVSILGRPILWCVAGHSGSSGLLTIALFITAPLVFYWVQVARRKRQQMAFKFRRIAVAMALYLGVIGVLLKLGFSPLEALAFGFLSEIGR